MRYKCYCGYIASDEEASAFTGRIAGINDVVGFHGDSVAELKAAFHEAVDDYIEACAKAGREPQKPFSGKVMFRLSPETHRKAAIAA